MTNEIANLAKLKVSRKTFCKAKRADNSSENPNGLYILAFKLEGVASNGEHKRNKNAVAYEADTANSLGKSTGNYRAKHDKEGVNEKANVNKKHTESHKALVLLEFQTEDNGKYRLDSYDTPDHSRAVVNDKVTHNFFSNVVL
jgi:hypothetical protein